MKYRNHILVLLVIIIINLGLYSRNLNDFFVSDDFDWVHITHTSEKNILSYFTTNYSGTNEGGSYRPFINILFKLDHSIWNLNPLGYHITNLVFHILTAFIIYLLILRFFNKKKDKLLIASLSGILFSILPSHAEVAIWISGRCDVSSIFFYILSFYIYLIFRKKKKHKYLILSLFFFIVSLLSKEMAISLPIIVFIYEWYKKDYRIKNIIKSIKYPFVYGILTLLFFIIRYKAIGLLFGYYGKSNMSIQFDKIYEMFIHLISNTFLFLNNRLVFFNYFKDKYLLFFIILSIIIYLIIKVSKYKKEIVFYLLFFFITMIPVLNLAYSSLNDEGERYSYLPSIALVIIIAIVLSNINNKYIKYILMITIILYFSYFSIQKSIIWDQASKISSNIVHGVVDKVDMDKEEGKEGIVIFTIPDNFEGAQVMRNGLVQAIEMYYYPYKINSLIIPIATLLNRDIHNTNLIKYNPNEVGFNIETKDNIITGPPHRKSVDLMFEMQGYNFVNFTATGTKLIFSEEFLKQNNIIYLGYNNGEIINLELK